MTTTAEHALFLAEKVDVLAGREDVGRFRSDVFRLVESIEKAINRPVPPVECGPCPTVLENQERCGTALQAKRDEIETTCWKCHITYNVQQLIDGALKSARDWLYTEREARDIMAQIGRHIPRGTWWSWVQREVIQNKNEWGAEPRYLLGDIQDAWEQRVGKRNAS